MVTMIRQEHLKTGARNMGTITNELLTRKQVAALFQMTAMTIIRLEESGKLPAIRIGTRVRYKRADVEALITAGATK
jgi:excisionase family DNA binding protein